MLPITSESFFERWSQVVVIYSPQQAKKMKQPQGHPKAVKSTTSY